MAHSQSSAKLFSFVILLVALLLTGCASPLGPGYVVEHQQVQVSFTAGPGPILSVSAEYHLANTGNQDLDSIAVRLPGRRFRPQAMRISWDGSPLAAAQSLDNPRDTLVRFAQSWKIGESHSLQFVYEIPSAPAREDALGFSADAFYLPSGGWMPQLPQARGVFGFGGVPPKQWLLRVRVPAEFLIHASGGKEKRSTQPGAVEYIFTQTARDLSTFVVAGRYRELNQQLQAGQRLRVWTRAGVDPAKLQGASYALSRTIATYDSLFGTRGQSRPPLFLIECPTSTGCIFQSPASYSNLLYGRAIARSVEMISRDTVLLDSRQSSESTETFASPALAEGWLGYGRNPGFYEQQPPMSALPAFAAALAREASSGSAVREEIVRRALAQIPENANASSNTQLNITRAKDLLLFYALRDRVGSAAFQRALQHLLYARQSRGFDVTDLISALEEESHQPVGPFVREWIKRPGVPEEFRRRYPSPDPGSGPAASSGLPQSTLLQEEPQ